MKNLTKYTFLFFFIFNTISCKFFNKDNSLEEVVARVGDSYLYKSDLYGVLSEGISREDSILLAQSYINNWATTQLFLEKAKINLSEEKIDEFESLIKSYRADLYIKAYQDILVYSSLDTVITDSELQSYYTDNKENFKLKEDILKLRYIEMPLENSNIEAVKQRFIRFNEEDEHYLDSISVQFRNYSLDTLYWNDKSSVVNKIPVLTPENEDEYLKKTKFFELKDSIGVYLIDVKSILNRNEVAPLSFIKPSIKQIILNKRKIASQKKLEQEVIDEAVKNKEFEIYEN